MSEDKKNKKPQPAKPATGKKQDTKKAAQTAPKKK